MAWVAHLIERIDQGSILVGLECNVEVDGGTSGWMTQTLPAGWNGMPGVFHTHVMPRHSGRREVGEGHYSEKEERREPVVSHDYRISGTVLQFCGSEDEGPCLEHQNQGQNAEFLSTEALRGSGFKMVCFGVITEIGTEHNRVDIDHVCMEHCQWSMRRRPSRPTKGSKSGKLMITILR